MKTVKIINLPTLLLLSVTAAFLIGGWTLVPKVKDQLKEKVKNVIEQYYEEPFKVSVDENRVVTVEGEVNTLWDKLRISELIESIDGVQKINNKITIQNDITADDIIKANIEDEIRSNDAILEPEKINVDVKKGVVILSGSVSYYREKVMAQSIASWQDGVNDLVSNIVVMPVSTARSDENLKTIITDIFKREFPLETNASFDVRDGIVNLAGSVKSLYARKHIEDSIQHILGIKGVSNNLVIENN
jgi:osmotically-inducible protein OsmY